MVQIVSNVPVGMLPLYTTSTLEHIIVDLGVETIDDGEGKVLTCRRWVERGAAEKAAEKLEFETYGGRKKKFWNWKSQAIEAEWDSPDEPDENRGIPSCGEAGSDENGLYEEYVLYREMDPDTQKKIDQEILRIC